MLAILIVMQVIALGIYFGNRELVSHLTSTTQLSTYFSWNQCANRIVKQITQWDRVNFRTCDHDLPGVRATSKPFSSIPSDTIFHHAFINRGFQNARFKRWTGDFFCRLVFVLRCLVIWLNCNTFLTTRCDELQFWLAPFVLCPFLFQVFRKTPTVGFHSNESSTIPTVH